MKSKYTFEMVDIDGQIMAVPVDTCEDEFKGVIRLNETGSAILEMLKVETSEAVIVSELMENYSVDKTLLVDAVHEFVQKLITEGIVK